MKHIFYLYISEIYSLPYLIKNYDSLTFTIPYEINVFSKCTSFGHRLDQASYVLDDDSHELANQLKK